MGHTVFGLMESKYSMCVRVCVSAAESLLDHAFALSYVQVLAAWSWHKLSHKARPARRGAEGTGAQAHSC